LKHRSGGYAYHLPGHWNNVSSLSGDGIAG
jgi:hypothetical protein